MEKIEFPQCLSANEISIQSVPKEDVSINDHFTEAFEIISIWQDLIKQNVPHYYVVKDRRTVSDYTDKEEAEKHAKEIGGEILVEIRD